MSSMEMFWEKKVSENPNPRVGPGRPGGKDGPGRRWGHTVTSARDGKMIYVFGGYGKHEKQTNDVYCYNIEKDTWVKPAMRGEIPKPRDSHSCTAIGQRLYVFGGTDGLNGLSELFFIDTFTNTWHCVPNEGEPPPPREGHAAAAANSKLYVFGGCGKEDLYYNDLHSFDPETGLWHLEFPRGKPPPPCDSHTFSSWGSTLVVFGGEDASNAYLNDCHTLDTGTMTWTQVKTTGERPRPRAGHTSIILGRSLLVFGGFTEERVLFNDVHVLDLYTGHWSVPSFPPTFPPFLPTPRFSLSVDLLDPFTGRILFFGGCDAQLEALDECIILHTGLTQEHTFSLPTPSRPTLSLKQELKRKRRGEGGRGVDKEGPLPHPPAPPSPGIVEGRITDVFRAGYCLEVEVGGRKMNGFLFSSNPGFKKAFLMRNEQKMKLAKTEETRVQTARKNARAEKRRAKLVAQIAQVEALGTDQTASRHEEGGASDQGLQLALI